VSHAQVLVDASNAHAAGQAARGTDQPNPYPAGSLGAVVWERARRGER
jgi:hypothetical protein